MAGRSIAFIVALLAVPLKSSAANTHFRQPYVGQGRGEKVELSQENTVISDQISLKQLQLLNDTSLICRNTSYKEPVVYYVDNNAVKCASQHFITWDVSLESSKPKTKNKGHVTKIPYDVTLGWISCGSPLNKLYFLSALKFTDSRNTTILHSVNIRGTLDLNGSQSVATWSVDLYDSEKLTKVPTKITPVPSQSPCPDIILASDSDSSNFGCLQNDSGSLTASSAKYLKCKDWVNCLQYVAYQFESFCQGVWAPAFCDTNPTSCKTPRQRIPNTGIIYCKAQEKDVAFYMPVFKPHIHKTLTNFTHIISDIEGDSKALVMLESLSKGNATAKHTKNTKFKCAAPKFLALEIFKWTIVYGLSNTNTTHNCSSRPDHSGDSYIEVLTCKAPAEGASWDMNVTCTVYLQSGHIVAHVASHKYVAHNGTTNASTETPHEKEEFLNETSDLPPTVYIVVGVASCFLLLFPILIFSYCRIKRQRRQIRFSSEEIDKFRKGTAMLNAIGPKEPQQSAGVLPYDSNLEVPRDKIIIEPKILGQGAFGKVMKGRIGERDVAIKTTNKNIDGQYFRALLSELKIMAFVGKHENVLELVGANTERIRKQEVYLIFEFCENGNLLEFIRSNRDLFDDKEGASFSESGSGYSLVEYENGATNRLCTEDLVRWSMEIASGMEFISSKKVYHGDLAARNILLTDKLVAKVGDFGLAKDLKDYSLYVQRLGCPLPLKWMSIESLQDLEFSIQSDVWSFGITLWEIFSLGSTPYPGVEWNFQAWKQLKDGERMDRPLHATESIFKIMMKCWETQPEDRPSFAELKRMLTRELEQLHILYV